MSYTLKEKYYQTKPQKKINFSLLFKILLVLFILGGIGLFVYWGRGYFLTSHSHSSSSSSSLALSRSSFQRTNHNVLANNLPVMDQKELTARYEKNLQEIIGEYKDREDEIDADFTKSLLDRLLSLTVPYQYKGFHLKLVLALNNLKEACLKSNEAEKEKALGKVEEVLKAWPK